GVCFLSANIQDGMSAENFFPTFGHGRGGYSVLLVVFDLFCPASVGFIDCLLHRTRDFIGIKNHKSVAISGSTTRCLGQGAFVSEKALLVSIDNSYQGYFGQIQSFPEKIDPNQHVKDPQPELL